jgi:hypothetical protein
VSSRRLPSLARLTPEHFHRTGPDRRQPQQDDQLGLFAVDATYHHTYLCHYWHAPLQSPCQRPGSDLRLAEKTQQAAHPRIAVINNRSDASSNRPRCPSRRSNQQPPWSSQKGITRKRPPKSRCVMRCMPCLPPHKNLVHIYPAELRRDPPVAASEPAESAPIRIANVAVSVPLPGISSGGSYVHLSWA